FSCINRSVWVAQATGWRGAPRGRRCRSGYLDLLVVANLQLDGQGRRERAQEQCQIAYSESTADTQIPQMTVGEYELHGMIARDALEDVAEQLVVEVPLSVGPACRILLERCRR